MSLLSTVLLYGGVLVAGALAMIVALTLTSSPSERASVPDDMEPVADQEVDPIKSLGF